MTNERVESEGFYEMLWDCDHCGTKRLLAKSQRYCAECGAPQNPDKRYYPPPDQETRVEGHEYVGADRTCPSCRSPMGAKAKNCTHCGSPLDGARDVKSVDERAPAAPPEAKKRRWPWILAIVLVAIAAIVFAIWFFFIRTRTAKLELAAHRWERTIDIVEFRDHDERAWRDQVPAGALPHACTREVRDHRQVKDGEDCHTVRKDKKDGTFEKQNVCTPKTHSEPIYDDKCSYTVRSWTKSDAVIAKGASTAPVWPTTTVPTDALPALGAKKQGARTEKLYLDFKGADSCDVSESVWRKYSDGQKVEVQVRARSGDVVCDSL